MRSLRLFVQFVLSVLVVGIAINLISDYLGKHHKSAEEP